MKYLVLGPEFTLKPLRDEFDGARAKWPMPLPLALEREIEDWNQRCVDFYAREHELPAIEKQAAKARLDAEGLKLSKEIVLALGDVKIKYLGV
jgi:hypothetical protein